MAANPRRGRTMHRHGPRPPRGSDKFGIPENDWANVDFGFRCNSSLDQSPDDGLGRLLPNLSLPAPQLESDFRMVLELSDATATVVAGDNSKKYTTFTDGAWSGRIGSGTVIASGFNFQPSEVSIPQLTRETRIGRRPRGHGAGRRLELGRASRVEIPPQDEG